MTKRVLARLLLITGFVLGVHGVFVLVEELRTWQEAVDHCTLHNDVLAVVQSDEDWSRVQQVHISLAWIGLYDPVNSWRWSRPGDALSFLNWDVGEPNNLGGNQLCVVLWNDGTWDDKNCDLSLSFICQNGGQTVLVEQSMSWSAAQSVCRQNFTDLITVSSGSQNQQLSGLMQNQVMVWIGLYRYSWTWLEQNISTAAAPLWASGKPDNGLGDEDCGAVDAAGRAEDAVCSDLLYFICQADTVRRQVLRLELRAGSDITEEMLLLEVEQALRSLGDDFQINGITVFESTQH